MSVIKNEVKGIAKEVAEKLLGEIASVFGPWNESGLDMAIVKTDDPPEAWPVFCQVAEQLRWRFVQAVSEVSQIRTHDNALTGGREISTRYKHALIFRKLPPE